MRKFIPTAEKQTDSPLGDLQKVLTGVLFVLLVALVLIRVTPQFGVLADIFGYGDFLD